MEILKVHSQKMNLKKVNLKDLVVEMENFSGAEVKAVCTEAGYFAIREERDFVTNDDFLMAIDKVRQEDEDEESGMIG